MWGAEEAPSTPPTGRVWETSPGESYARGPPVPGRRWPAGPAPHCPGRRSQRRLPRAPPRPRPPVPLLNHLSLATRGRTTPEDRAAGWHAPCRNKQSLPAFGHSSRPPAGVPSVTHTARGPRMARALQTQRNTDAPRRLLQNRSQSSCPPRLGREPQTFFFTFLVSVRDPPHPAYPGPTRRHLVRSQTQGPKPFLPFCSDEPRQTRCPRGQVAARIQHLSLQTSAESRTLSLRPSLRPLPPSLLR